MRRAKRSITGRTFAMFPLLPTGSGALTLPDNSGFSVLLDTTNGIPGEDCILAAKIAAVPSTPGATRGQALGRSFSGIVAATGQNVTVQLYGLTGAAGWALLQSQSITAGTPATFGPWTPSEYGSSDALILVAAGATAPSALTATLNCRDLP